jgi:hypothetical protein
MLWALIPLSDRIRFRNRDRIRDRNRDRNRDRIRDRIRGSRSDRHPMRAVTGGPNGC